MDLRIVRSIYWRIWGLADEGIDDLGIDDLGIRSNFSTTRPNLSFNSY